MAIKLTPSNNGDDGCYGDNVRVYVPTTYSPVGISPDKWPKLKRPYIIAIALVLLVAAVILIAHLLGAFDKKGCDGLCPPNPTTRLPPSPSKLHIFQKAAVCSDGPPCAEIGRNILQQNGSAVDATLAAMFCNGIVNMQSMGLGGGFLMTIYIRENQTAHFLNAREAAPLKAKPELYKDDEQSSKNGPLAIAVPGELKGYWEAHKKFGKLPWKAIIEPSIKLCESGYILGEHQYYSLFRNARIKNDTNLKSWFLDQKGDFKKKGSKIVPKNLCQTLKIIAENGGDDFYNGTLSRKLLEDLKEAGSIIEQEDLLKYKAKWETPISVQLNNSDHIYTAPLPGSGVLLALILSILDGYNFTPGSLEDNQSTVTTYHRMIEAFKYAYAKRTELGDTAFVNVSELLTNLTSKEYAEEIRLKINDNQTSNSARDYGAVFYSTEDHGTAHISVLAENGDAVSVTSTVNIYFGAGLTSKQTGIILNSGMDDFSLPYFKNYFGLPGSPNNKMVPGKRSLSSMSPTIITDKNGDVEIVIGASGGTKIVTAIAQVIMRILWFKQNIKEAVDYPRFHHQIFPMEVGYEYGTLQQEIEGLEALGHKTKRFGGSGSIICVLFKLAEKIYANADYRKGGDVYGLD